MDIKEQNTDQKKEWKKPEIISLSINKTLSGETQGTPEELGYDAVIS